MPAAITPRPGPRILLPDSIMSMPGGGTRGSYSQNVPYTVHYAGGATDTVTVNQENNGAKWNLLGTYNFQRGRG